MWNPRTEFNVGEIEKMQGRSSAWLVKHELVHRSFGFDYKGIETGKRKPEDWYSIAVIYSLRISIQIWFLYIPVCLWCSTRRIFLPCVSSYENTVWCGSTRIGMHRQSLPQGGIESRNPVIWICRKFISSTNGNLLWVSSTPETYRRCLNWSVGPYARRFYCPAPNFLLKKKRARQPQWEPKKVRILGASPSFDDPTSTFRSRRWTRLVLVRQSSVSCQVGASSIGAIKEGVASDLTDHR